MKCKQGAFQRWRQWKMPGHFKFVCGREGDFMERVKKHQL